MRNNNYIDFMVGIGLGYGLSAEHIEELKQCFVEKEQLNRNYVDLFLEKSRNSNPSSKEGTRNNNKEVAQGFLSNVFDFFSNFKDCVQIRDTLLSFALSKLKNYAIKGAAYVFGGIFGVLLKGVYDTYRIISQINYFHEVESKQPVDYTELGSTVGKIASIAQNIALKKRFK